MEITAHVITIGDEILWGEITDTNSQWISGKLTEIGIKTTRKLSVGDVGSEIRKAIDEGLNHAQVVILTGGLGPTRDDITKTTIADYFGVGLIENPEALEAVKLFFASRNRVMRDINLGQALLPENCTYLPNAAGTAPGMWFEHEGKVLVSLPGVPYEMKELMLLQVLPKLQSQFSTPFILHRKLQLAGLGESEIATVLTEFEDQLPSHIKLAYLPSPGKVTLRFTGIASDKNKLQTELDNLAHTVAKTFPDNLTSLTNEALNEVVVKGFIKRQLTLATAESCTGGYIASQITQIPGSSAMYRGSVVAYHNQVKMGMLNVEGKLIEQFGAVSKQVAEQMAYNARILLGADVAIATTGIAGPTGGTEQKPVGTVWVAIADINAVESEMLSLGDRLNNNKVVDGGGETGRSIVIKLTSQHLLYRLVTKYTIDKKIGLERV